MEVDAAVINTIIDKYGKDKSYLLAMFQDVQRQYRYLPKEAIQHICDRLRIPFSKGYEVATFYSSISLTPRGKHTVHVCLGTACHLRGGPNILDTFERELKIKRGDTTENGLFTLESVNCLGACALAPLVRVDGHDYGKTTPGSVKKIIKEYGEST